MRIIHLLSNWKWTERSEPAVDLALNQQRLGEKVWLVCGEAPPESGSEPDVSFHAGKKGLGSVIALPEMTKHLNFLSAFRGVRKLREIISGTRPDVIHCHMRNDHLLAGLASAKNKGPILVRSSYNPDHPGRDFRSRLSYRLFTHGMIVVREKARQSAVSESYFPRKIKVIHPGIDLERFSPDRELSGTRDFGPLNGCFVAGVVSRIRETRRIDIALKVLHSLQDSYPGLRLLLVGRGRPGAYEKVVEKPAAKLGVGDRIIRAGYCRDDELVEAYRHMDVLVYPMPGSDKTCRTVREAMACGVPVIAPAMDFLPELVSHGKNGFLVELSAEAFTLPVKKLMDSPEKREEFSKQALSYARENFSLRSRAENTLSFYKSLMQEAHSSTEQ